MSAAGEQAPVARSSAAAVVGKTVGRTASVSADGVYRYELGRVWEPARPRAVWVMLNPSTADGRVDDPTVRRCMGFAAGWGYGGITVLNLFALRATNPAVLDGHPAPAGPDNAARLGRHLLDALFGRELVVCAWGARPAAAGPGERLRRLAARHGVVLHHLGLTAAGAPRHPLYLPARTRPSVWPPPAPDAAVVSAREVATREVAVSGWRA